MGSIKKLRDAYQLRFGKRAQALLDKYQAEKDIASLRAAAYHYRFTNEGASALEKLAAHYLDRQRFSVASALYDSLLNLPHYKGNDLTYLQAALAFSGAEENDRAESAWQKVPETVTLANGSQVKKENLQKFRTAEKFGIVAFSKKGRELTQEYLDAANLNTEMTHAMVKKGGGEKAVSDLWKPDAKFLVEISPDSARDYDFNGVKTASIQIGRHSSHKAEEWLKPVRCAYGAQISHEPSLRERIEALREKEPAVFKSSKGLGIHRSDYDEQQEMSLGKEDLEGVLHDKLEILGFMGFRLSEDAIRRVSETKVRKLFFLGGKKATTSFAKGLPSLENLESLAITIQDKESGSEVASVVGRLRNLMVFSGSDEALEPILRSPDLKRVRNLDLSEYSPVVRLGLTRKSIERLLEAKELNLDALHVSDIEMGDDLGSRLVQNEGIRSFRRTNDFLLETNEKIFTLYGAGIGDKTALAISQKTTPKGVNRLDLWRNKIGPEGAKAIATMKGLEDISLHNNPIGDEGAIALAKSSTMKSLRYLNLMDTGLTEKGVRAILDSPNLPKLRSLSLGMNEKIPAELLKEVEKRMKQRRAIDTIKLMPSL